MPATYAYAWRSGQIEFGPTVPDGALKIGRLGSGVRKRDIRALARLSRRDNHTLLVPGIPEAYSDDEALTALNRFIGWVRGERW